MQDGDDRFPVELEGQPQQDIVSSIAHQNRKCTIVLVSGTDPTIVMIETIPALE